VTAYLRILKFVAPYRWKFLGAIGCMVVLAIANTAYVNLMGPLLVFLFTGKTDAVGSIAKLAPSSLDLESTLAGLDRAQLLAALPFVLVAVAALKGAAAFGQNYMMGMVSQRVVADIRRALFDHLLKLSPSFFTRRHSGDLMSRFSADVGAVENALVLALATYIRSGLQVVVMLANCFWLDWRMSFISFGAVPLTLLPVIRLGKRIKSVTTQSQSSLGRIAELVQETLSGMRVVQAFGMEKWESERFASVNRDWLRIQRRSFIMRSLSSPLMEVIAAVGLAVAIWWVGGRILSGELEAGKFFSFVTAVLLLYDPVKQLGRQGQTAL
jgi:subfamily B ATP-binding cassette protein MsbA